MAVATAPKGLSQEQFIQWLANNGAIPLGAVAIPDAGQQSYISSQWSAYRAGQPVTVGSPADTRFADFATTPNPGIFAGMSTTASGTAAASPGGTSPPVAQAGPAVATANPAVSPPVTGSGSPDAASLLGQGNSSFAQFLQAGQAAGLFGGATTGSTLFASVQSRGIEPKAKVNGYLPGRTPVDVQPQQPQPNVSDLGFGIGGRRMPAIDPNSAASPANLLQTQTVDQWLTGLYKMTPGQLDDLRMRLFSQGWYGNTSNGIPYTANDVGFGKGPDPLLIQAYGDALGQTARYNSAGNPITVDGVISAGAPAGIHSGGTKPDVGRPFYAANPIDYTKPLQTEAEKELGRDIPTAEANAYGAREAGQENAARAATVSARDLGQDTPITAAPSPTAAAQQFIDTEHMIERSTYGAATRQQQFFGMLRNPVSGG